VTTYRVLLPHPLEPRLLMMQAHGEWRLPEWSDSTEHQWQVTEHVNRAVAARFGMETTVLRCVRISGGPDSGTQRRTYMLDNHSAPHDTVPASTWIGRGELDMLRITDPEVRELVADWFSRDAGELPAHGPAWTRRGWYIEALAWTIARLNDIGETTIGTPAQLRAWERSFLMRVTAETGHFYFKAVPERFRHEPLLMQWLAEKYPDNMPEIVAVDAACGWFLQREASGAALPLNEVREEEEWYRAVRRLAEIQIATASRSRELAALGCPHRGLEVLARRIPRLCADAGAMMLGHPDGLNRREIERLALLAPTLISLCEELASYHLPDTLEHGDLWASNVLSTLSGPVYLDWSDSSLSHPFFSLALLMTEAAGLLPTSSTVSRRSLRDSYLLPWRGIAAADSLIRAFELARILAPVHLAATVYTEMLPTAGHRWELAAAVPINLRRVLQMLRDESVLLDAE
jgi:hypothetical protein